MHTEHEAERGCPQMDVKVTNMLSEQKRYHVTGAHAKHPATVITAAMWGALTLPMCYHP